MKFILSIFLSLQIIIPTPLSGQDSYVLENIFNLNLKFKMHRDSLPKSFEIHCGDGIYDSTTIDVNGLTLNLNKILKDQTVSECQYPSGNIQTYLFSKLYSDSFYVFLDFHANRLISFDIYYKSEAQWQYVNKVLKRHFGDTGRRLSDKRIKVYSSDNTYQPFNSLLVLDKGAYELVPPWCGNAKRRGTSWAKLEKYLNRK